MGRRYCEITAAVEDLAIARHGFSPEDRTSSIRAQLPLLRERHDLILALAELGAEEERQAA